MTDLLNTNPIYIFLFFLVIGLFIFFVPRRMKFIISVILIVYIGAVFYLQKDLYSQIKNQPTVAKQADCLKNGLMFKECSKN
jgi:NADH:ubiquinone oxidoreductase subunit 6 (subunit J)